MTDRIIPLLDVRSARLPLPRDTGIGASASGADTTDRLSRPLRDLRISVTDRCNFRCTYCMPKEIFDQEHRYLKHVEVLRFEEITLLARAFIANGVHKIRLTGGEPLLRKDIEKLVAMLAQLRTLDGEPLDIALTTNASLLKRKARALADAGLKRITVSLDGLDDAVFRRMNDVDFPVADVLAGIDAAADAGLGPVKINMVVKRGVNDHEVAAMARHFRGSGHIVRYIEFMDVGSSNGWRLDDVVPSAQIVERISREVAPLDPVDANYAGEVAGRWRYRDGSGEIGVISSVTQAFCGTCTRARLSTEGMLYLCLFADHGYDLRQLVRRDESAGGPADEAEIAAAIAGIWRQRGDRYSELRSQQTPQRAKVEMSYIGG